MHHKRERSTDYLVISSSVGAESVFLVRNNRFRCHGEPNRHNNICGGLLSFALYAECDVRRGKGGKAVLPTLLTGFPVLVNVPDERASFIPDSIDDYEEGPPVAIA